MDDRYVDSVGMLVTSAQTVNRNLARMSSSTTKVTEKYCAIGGRTSMKMEMPAPSLSYPHFTLLPDKDNWRLVLQIWKGITRSRRQSW
jgi:hypothetical protein